MTLTLFWRIFKHFKLTGAQIVSFGVVIWLRTEQKRKFRSILGWDKEMSLFFLRSRKTLGPTQVLIQWLSEALPPGQSGKKREADHSPTSGEDANNKRNYNLYSHIYLHGGNREEFIFLSPWIYIGLSFAILAKGNIRIRVLNNLRYLLSLKSFNTCDMASRNYSLIII
jgi:hypothetical protein